MNNENNEKPAIEPGNDIINGIERWVPQTAAGKSGVAKPPKSFAYKSPTGVWYKSIGEAHAVLSRGGMTPDKYVPVLKDARGDSPDGEGA